MCFDNITCTKSLSPWAAACVHALSSLLGLSLIDQLPAYALQLKGVCDELLRNLDTDAFFK